MAAILIWNRFLKCYFSNLNLFMFSNLESISLKNFFGKVVFQILANIEMMQIKNRLFGRNFETVHHFKIVFQNYGFLIVRTYLVQILLQNSGGKVFS